MPENYYKTSKNYDKLFDLVNSGNKVVCYIDYNYSFSKDDYPPCRDICQCSLTKFGEIEFNARGICYLSVNNSSPADFKHYCERLNVEFIPPPELPSFVKIFEYIDAWLDGEPDMGQDDLYDKICELCGVK